MTLTHPRAGGSRTATAVALLAACACLFLCSAPGASARTSPPRAFSVSLPIPSAGDATYAMGTVRLEKTRAGAAVRGKRIFSQSTGGLRITARSRSWSKLRRSLRVYTVVSRAPGSSRLREVAFFIVRRAGGKAGSGTVSFSISDAGAYRPSFFVRSVARNGRASVFTVKNAVATAIGNWSRYMLALTVSHALSAAYHAIDHTRLPERPRGGTAAAATARGSRASGSLWIGGQHADLLSRQLFALLVNTMGHSDEYSAAKRSPLVTAFIAHELNNPALAVKWGQVVAALPLHVPDEYAAAAQEEKKFGHVSNPRISRHQVVIADSINMSGTLLVIDAVVGAFNATSGSDQVSISVRKSGTGSGTITTDLPATGVIDCGSFCSATWIRNLPLDLVATPAPGSAFAGWQGCDGPNTGSDANHCLEFANKDKEQVTAVFNTVAAPPSSGGGGSGGGSGGGGTGGGGTGTFTGPPSIDNGFGTAGTASLTSQPVDRVVEQSNGDYLVLSNPAGSSTTIVLRVTSSGAVDGSFNDVTEPSASGYYFVAGGLTVAPDDSFYVGGLLIPTSSSSTSPTEAVVEHFGADGTPDTSYRMATAALPGSPASGDSYAGGQIALQPNGGIVLIAGDYNSGTQTADLVRFEPSSPAQPDPNFGNTSGAYPGVETFQDQGSSTGFSDVVAQSTGQIVASGFSDAGSYSDTLFAFDGATGAPATGFGTGGVATLPGELEAYESSLQVLPGDALLLGGTAVDNSSSSGAYEGVIARWNADGSPDTQFNGGAQTFALPANSFAGVGQVGLVGNDAVLISGQQTAGPGPVQIDAANATTGAPDTSYGAGGEYVDASTPQFYVDSGVIDATRGQLVAAGSANIGSGTETGFLRRYTLP